jgi:hypothetical protein
MSIAISAYKRRSIRHYLQLFVGGFMSYLFVFVCVEWWQTDIALRFLISLFSLCVLCAQCCQFFFGLSILDCPFGVHYAQGTFHFSFTEYFFTAKRSGCVFHPFSIGGMVPESEEVI